MEEVVEGGVGEVEEDVARAERARAVRSRAMIVGWTGGGGEKREGREGPAGDACSGQRALRRRGDVCRGRGRGRRRAKRRELRRQTSRQLLSRHTGDRRLSQHRHTDPARSRRLTCPAPAPPAARGCLSGQRWPREARAPSPARSGQSLHAHARFMAPASSLEHSAPARLLHT